MAPLPGEPALGIDGPPPGRALLDAPSSWPRRIVTLVLVVAVAAGAYAGYRRVTRPDVVAIGSPYRSSTGVTIDLPPGPGWHADRTARLKRTNGPSWLRGEMIFRGPSAASASEFVLLVRAHAPGGFARAFDRAKLRADLERQLGQQATAAGATPRNLSCVDEDSWQPGIAEVCYGRLFLAGHDVGAGAYLWVVGDDDLIGIVYATEDVSLDALEVMARSAR
jgi:hypothetical protein